MYTYGDRKYDVRISEKVTLSINEASAFTGIGVNKLRRLSNSSDCDFVLHVGAKRMFKRRKLVEYLESQYSI